jgi:two-component system sensor histidine kinase BarA
MSLKDHGSALSLQLASSSEYGVFANNKTILLRMIENTAEDSDVLSIAIYGTNQKKLGHIGHYFELPANIDTTKSSMTVINNEARKSIVFITPILLRDVLIEDYSESVNSPFRDVAQSSINQKVIGWVVLELGRANTKLKQYKTLFTSGCILLLGLLISGLFAKRLGKDVTTPIIRLTAAVEKIKNGEFSTRVFTGASGELRILESGINSMAQSLKIAHGELQKNIDQATADLRKTLKTIEIQNEELDAARKEALTASRVKSEFLANMSHEIRTPMNGIIGFTQLLLKTPCNDQQYDYLITIQRSANSLLVIINDILDFSKIEAEKLEIEETELDILDCVEEVVYILAPVAHSKKIEIVPIVYSDVPRKLIGDPLRLKQVLTNLVNNAIKFTEAGSVVVRVMLEKKKQNHVVIKVSVTDTGIGLTEEERSNIFQAFTQADNTTARKFGGTGLGLVISQKLVERMGGEIRVETHHGEGSIFCFTFKATIDPNILQEQKLSIHTENQHFLLCEEHPITRLSIKHKMISWGVHPLDISELSMVEAQLLLAKNSNKPISLVILGINAIENYQSILSTLKAMVKKYKSEFAVMINASDQSIHSDVLKKGAAFCLVKPVLSQKLFAAIQSYLQFYLKKNNVLMIEKMEKKSSAILYDPPEKQLQKFLNIKVLAVDDNDANLKLIEILLKNMGIIVTTAHSGQEALQAVQHETFDLILMDIQMPNMDGIETTEAIRMIEAKRPNQTPIIALTAHALLGENEKFIEKGMNDYLSKPINEAQLETVLQKWTTVYKKIQSHIQNKKKNIQHDATLIPRVTPIDMALGIQLANGNQTLAKELLQMFINELPIIKTQIKTSYADHDLDNLEHYVHKLHGSCCYLGVPCLKHITAELEKMLKTHQSDKIGIWIEKLHRELEVVYVAGLQLIQVEVTALL